MSAQQQMRQMLDQLMGTGRNGKIKILHYQKPKKMTKKIKILGEVSNSLKFSDTRVCKSFLVGCCPHDILATTVSNLIFSPLTNFWED